MLSPNNKDILHLFNISRARLGLSKKHATAAARLSASAHVAFSGKFRGGDWRIKSKTNCNFMPAKPRRSAGKFIFRVSNHLYGFAHSIVPFRDNTCPKMRNTHQQ
jgi:hypothetical protein